MRYPRAMMAPSSPVSSRQSEPHPRLADAVAKHATHAWRKPVADHSRRIFEVLARQLATSPAPLILDTGCGTGMSTGVLARRHPAHWVIGVDKSEARLHRAPDLPDNTAMVRIDLEDFWLLARDSGWTFDRQCFFYPNPWPKPEQRLRRWPFHPVFPVALSCGGRWELRTNWEVYAQEFALAYGMLTGSTTEVEPWFPREPETLFEKKYQESGHPLWRWVSPEPASRGTQ